MSSFSGEIFEPKKELLNIDRQVAEREECG